MTSSKSQSSAGCAADQREDLRDKYARIPLKALVVTNMWPSAEDPALGIFVSDQVEALRRAGADVDVFAFKGGSLFAYLRAAARLATRRRVTYDVVHAHFGLSAWVSLAAKANSRAVTFHGTDLSHPRSRRLSLMVMRFMDLRAAASEELADRIPQAASAHPIQVLPCGVSLERMRPLDRRSARAELGLPLDARVILLPSDPIRPEKRADRAREIAKGTGATLISLGGVLPSRVPTFIGAADLVLIPSEREGFGLAVLEALACETPVISTPVGIAPTAVSSVTGAHVAEWDPSEWTALAEEAFDLGETSGGRESASRWSSDACAEGVLKAWRRATSESHANSR